MIFFPERISRKVVTAHHHDRELCKLISSPDIASKWVNKPICQCLLLSAQIPPL